MHNVWLIAKREYLERIRAKSFIVMTVLIPTLMGGLLFALGMANAKGAADVHLAVVCPQGSQDERFGLDLQSELATRHTPKFSVDVLSPSTPAAASTRAELDEQLKGKDLDGYLWVTPASATHPRATFQFTHRSGNFNRTKDILSVAIRDVLTRESLAHSGMGASDVTALMQPAILESGAGGDDDSAEANAYGFFFIMYFVIVFYGMNVARSIIEEKTSRIFEVLLATIKPEELLAGKVIGVGSVGLTQIAIWLVAAIGLSFYGTMGSDITIKLTVVQGIYFVVFFLLGYTIYSGMAAALGAMTSSEQELQQMNIFLMLPLIACSGVIGRVMSQPDGVLARVFSFIPFCAPLIMYVRIAIHQPPWYEIAASITGTVVTLIAILWLAARIYRVGILMYGKKPNLPEIVRWLKYS